MTATPHPEESSRVKSSAGAAQHLWMTKTSRTGLWVEVTVLWHPGRCHRSAPAHPRATGELPGKQPRMDKENLLIPNKDYVRREKMGLVT